MWPPGSRGPTSSGCARAGLRKGGLAAAEESRSRAWGPTQSPSRPLWLTPGMPLGSRLALVSSGPACPPTQSLQTLLPSLRLLWVQEPLATLARLSGSLCLYGFSLIPVPHRTALSSRTHTQEYTVVEWTHKVKVLMKPNVGNCQRHDFR